MSEHVGVHDGSPSHTLDRVRMGGTKIVLTARQRLAEVSVALDHGQFTHAAQACSSLHEKLSNLAAAETELGSLADVGIVRIHELEVGMKVLDAGVVTEIGPCENCGKDGCKNLAVKFENGSAATLGPLIEVAVIPTEE